jgi:hypothetical protein
MVKEQAFTDNLEKIEERVEAPDVRVPIRTYSGWSLRSGAWANDGCEGTGQMIAFPKTKADRLASGDPRLSIEERYPSFPEYAAKVNIKRIINRSAKYFFPCTCCLYSLLKKL